MLFSTFSNDVSDLPRYEKEWVPKIKSYNAKLNAGILSEFKIPDDRLPLQEELDKGINAVEFMEQFLTDEEKSLTDLTGPVLAMQIAAGDVTAVQALKAYAKRATMAHQLTNCAMELFVEEGLQRAEELDAYLKETGKTVGPLHGLPISLKEHYNYEGKVTHASFVGSLDNVSTLTAQTVADMKKQGAVFYIRTSQPQMLMHLCSRNNITGTTRNPWNTSLTPGGSSSGEGVIAAMKGSVFGLGSDIGGSIRCPAAFCGVWGLRPTQKRVSCAGMSMPYPDQVQEAVYPVMGPLAGSADGLDLFMKCVIDLKPWTVDPLVLPIPWKDVPQPDAKSLKIAVCYDDGMVKPTPPILRAINHSVKKLKEAGVQVVEWDNINVSELIHATYSGYNSDGNVAQKSFIAKSGEPLVKLTEKYLSFGCGDAGLSGVEVQKVCYVRDSGRVLYLNQMNDQEIDFVLSPTYVSVAAKPETVTYWGYTNLWNILDFPNVIFPTGLSVDSTLDIVDTSFEPRSDLEAYEYGLYTGPEDFKDAPICLQLTGRRYEDETVIKAAKTLNEIITA